MLATQVSAVEDEPRDAVSHAHSVANRGGQNPNRVIPTRAPNTGEVC